MKRKLTLATLLIILAMIIAIMFCISIAKTTVKAAEEEKEENLITQALENSITSDENIKNSETFENTNTVSESPYGKLEGYNENIKNEPFEKECQELPIEEAIGQN